jgi:hypothetical protein
MTWYDFKHWYKDNRAETWTIVAVSVILVLFVNGFIWVVRTLDKAADEAHQVVLTTETEKQSAPATPADPPKVYDYNPPAIEVEYRKEYIEGEIETVKWNGDGPYSEEKLGDKPLPHYVPDWTDITYLPPGDDVREETVQFCGNVLNKFDPHTKIKMILHATNVGDYNDCYKSSAPLSFGGKPTPPSNIVKPSVPGTMK